MPSASQRNRVVASLLGEIAVCVSEGNCCLHLEAMSCGKAASLAAASTLDGIPSKLVQRISSLGASGKCPNNMERDLHRLRTRVFSELFVGWPSSFDIHLTYF